MSNNIKIDVRFQNSSNFYYFEAAAKQSLEIEDFDCENEASCVVVEPVLTQPNKNVSYASVVGGNAAHKSPFAS